MQDLILRSWQGAVEGFAMVSASNRQNRQNGWHRSWDWMDAQQMKRSPG